MPAAAIDGAAATAAIVRGKCVIVTGGSYGMGTSVVAALAAGGARVAAMARSAEAGEQQAAACRSAGGDVAFHRCDVADRASVQTAFAAAVAWMGRLDALVHIAGIEETGPAESATDESWERLFAVNARGTFHVNQEAFPYLRDRGGRIVNFGSGAGVLGMPANPVYSASKGAVVAWSRAIAQAWGQYGINVNIVAPAIWTPMYDQFRARLTPEDLARHDALSASRTLIGGKLGDPDTDLAPVILFLVSDGSRFITGQTIPVDGGRLMVR